jgi:inner membrane protein
MDPLTHCCIGGLAGKSLQRWNGYRWSMLLGAVAGELPDIDVFWAKGAENGLLEHRALTHSLFGGLGLALVIALIFFIFQRKKDGKTSFTKLTITAYIGILLHIFADWITSYGTQVFAPFSHERLALSTVFIVDFGWTSVLLVLALLALFWRKEAYRIAAIGMGVALIYPWINWGIKQQVKERVTKEYGQAFDKIEIETDFLSPWYWRIIGEKNGTYQMSSFRLLHPNDFFEWQSYKKISPEEWTALENKFKFFKTYRWFAVYPYRLKKDGKEYIGDLRFVSLQPLAKSYRQSDGIPPLGVQLESNEANEVIRIKPRFGDSDWMSN